jgi:hypothetical protein
MLGVEVAPIVQERVAEVASPGGLFQQSDEPFALFLPHEERDHLVDRRSEGTGLNRWGHLRSRCRLQPQGELASASKGR